MKKGIFYAVGVGAGEPGNITTKAKQILETADVIVIPNKKGRRSVAFQIAEQAASMEHAELLKLSFSMKSAADYSKQLDMNAIQQICMRLDNEKSVAMITLGDVSIYSTASYVRQAIQQRGYETVTIPGISSFSAGAAACSVNLCQNQESLLILPAVKLPEEMNRLLDLCDNLVVMKAGSALSWLIPLLRQKGLLEHTVMCVNVGMEHPYIGPPKLELEPSYFTTLIVKRGGL